MKKYYLQDHGLTLPVILYSVIAIGIFLVIYQFVFNRSLWIDEAQVALNIINKDFLELTKTLDHHQSAPIGFLFIERLSVLIFGKNEMALRLFPFISFFFAIYFFYLLANKLTNNRIITLISVSIFSIIVMILRYSSEVKQFPIDILFAMMIIYFSLTLQLNNNRSLFIYAILGATAIWFSNASVIILALAGLYVLYVECYQKKNYKVLFSFFIWIISFSFFYYFVVYNHPFSGSMKAVWHHAFMPLNPFSKDLYIFIYEHIADMYHLLGFVGYFWLIPFVVSLSGIVFMIKYQKYTLLYFSISPVILHLLLSSVELYPFTGRFLLYIVPLIMLMYAFGLYYLFDFLNKKIIRLPSLLLAFPVLVMFYPVYVSFPIEVEEIRKSLKYIEKNIKNDETVYVYYGAKMGYNFYKDANIIDINNTIIVGAYYRNEKSKLNDELSALKGKIWLLFSHVYPMGKSDNEEKYMVDYLVDKGVELLDVKKYTGSSAYYIDTKKPD